MEGAEAEECDWTILWRESEWEEQEAGPNDQHLQPGAQLAAGEWARGTGTRAAASAWQGRARGALWEEGVGGADWRGWWG